MGPNISPYLVPFAVDQEPRLVHQAILAVPEMLRPHLGRVVLCGGLARLPNLPRRLRRPRAQGPKIEVFVGRLAEKKASFSLSTWHSQPADATCRPLPLVVFPARRAELRRLLPSHWPVEILLEDHPELSVWRGGMYMRLGTLLRESSPIRRQTRRAKMRRVGVVLLCFDLYK